MTHFLSLDERRAWREREVKGKYEGGKPRRSGWQIDNELVEWLGKILRNLSLIMVGPVLLWCTVWAVVVDLW
jgi:hypothetical protein